MPVQPELADHGPIRAETRRRWSGQLRCVAAGSPSRPPAPWPLGHRTVGSLQSASRVGKRTARIHPYLWRYSPIIALADQMLSSP